MVDILWLKTKTHWYGEWEESNDNKHNSLWHGMRGGKDIKHERNTSTKTKKEEIIKKKKHKPLNAGMIAASR